MFNPHLVNKSNLYKINNPNNKKGGQNVSIDFQRVENNVRPYKTYDPSMSSLNNPMKRLEVKKEISYTTKYPKYQQISSNDRDTAIYQEVNHYRINFQSKLKNIVEIELITAIFPNTTNILLEPYLVLEIDELSSNIEFSSNDINKAFAILPLKKPNDTTGSFIVPELGQNRQTVMYFRTPLASLDRMTISIKDMNGNLFNFGSDTLTPTKALQNTFLFKITTLDPDTNGKIETHAIY
jgi:hypothetical protein